MSPDDDENEFREANGPVIDKADATDMAGLSSIDSEINIPAETMISMSESAECTRDTIQV
jgi:hypothetical protein